MLLNEMLKNVLCAEKSLKQTLFFDKMENIILETK